MFVRVGMNPQGGQHPRGCHSGITTSRRGSLRLSDTWVRGVPVQLQRVHAWEPLRASAGGWEGGLAHSGPSGMGFVGWGFPPPSPWARCGIGPSGPLFWDAGLPGTERGPWASRDRWAPHAPPCGRVCECAPFDAHWGLMSLWVVTCPGFHAPPSVALAQERLPLLAAPSLGYRDHAGVSCGK